MDLCFGPQFGTRVLGCVLGCFLDTSHAALVLWSDVFSLNTHIFVSRRCCVALQISGLEFWLTSILPVKAQLLFLKTRATDALFY